MADVLTAIQRAKCMSAITCKNTKPEVTVRRIAHTLGYRFRLHLKDLPGKPDLAFPRLHSVVFVHGCFWHQHNCKDGHIPKSRMEYWAPKLKSNQRRDRRRQTELRKLGWRVLVIWECQLKRPHVVAARLQRFLKA